MRSQAGVPVPLQIVCVEYAAKTSSLASLITRTRMETRPGGGLFTSARMTQLPDAGRGVA